MFGRLVILIVSFLGAAGLGQGPEIATQYEQRLGGALDELRTVIAQFDADVEKNGLTREEAIATYEKSGEPFLKDRGASMVTTLKRFDALKQQVSDLKTASPAYKPVYLAIEHDQQLMEGVMEDYSFGLPATASGFLYGGLGLLFGGLLGWLFRLACGLDIRPSKIRISE